MYFDFATVLVFAIVAVLFVLVTLAAGRLLFRPRKTSRGDKGKTYECGEPTIGDAWIRFDIRFYTVALMFVIFDVEVVLLFPWGRVFREMTEAGLGWLAFVEAATFILILAAGLAYVWVRRDIDWTPQPGEEPRIAGTGSRPERAGRIVAPREAVGTAGAQGGDHA